MSEANFSNQHPYVKGDVVYLVEGAGVVGGGELVVKKATVDSIDGPSHSPDNPSVILWQDAMTDPGQKLPRTKANISSRELFSGNEVTLAVQTRDTYLAELDLCSEPNSADILMHDPRTNYELAQVLGGIVVARRAEDYVRNASEMGL